MEGWVLNNLGFLIKCTVMKSNEEKRQDRWSMNTYNIFCFKHATEKKDKFSLICGRCRGMKQGLRKAMRALHRGIQFDNLRLWKVDLSASLKVAQDDLPPAVLGLIHVFLCMISAENLPTQNSLLFSHNGEHKYQVYLFCFISYLLYSQILLYSSTVENMTVFFVQWLKRIFW